MQTRRTPLGRLGQLFLLLALLSPAWSEISSRDSDNFVNPSEDYDDVFGDGKKHTTPPSPTEDYTLVPCYDDICDDLPAGCAELAAKHHCSCPGVSLGPSALPEAPVVKAVWPNGENVEVRWCAAHAAGTSYRVLVGGKQVGQFGDLTRSMKDLAGVSAGAEVCVQAVNDMGQSQLEGPACRVYEPPKGSPSLALKVGLIGGALGLLLLVLVAALLWKCKSRRKHAARGNTDGPL